MLMLLILVLKKKKSAKKRVELNVTIRDDACCLKVSNKKNQNLTYSKDISGLISAMEL